MSATNIQWATHVWNPVVGCSKVSEGCRNCYAMVMARRIAAAADARQRRGERMTPVLAAYQQVVLRDGGGAPLPQWSNKVVCIPERLDEPLGWRKPRRVFVDSESDLFHEAVPDEFLDQVFAVMAVANMHTFIVLTKRPPRMRGYLHGGLDRRLDVATRAFNLGRRGIGPYVASDIRMNSDAWPPPNIWLGVSAEDQGTLDERVAILRETPAAKRFISLEPLLDEHIELTEALEGIDWVIVGGESGPQARECDVLAVDLVVRQCKAAGVACFVKQLGSRPILGDIGDPWGWPEENSPVDWETGKITLRDPKGGDPAEWPEHLRVREWPE